MNEQKILEKLKHTRDRALARYSGFKVGAVLVTKNGKLYTGHNIESSSYGLTICAERVALFKALSEGEREFKEIYIMSNNDEFCPPCGACRQLLMDYAPDVQVVLMTESGKKTSYSIEELLPVAFTEKRLIEKKS